jgi:hypothetical protein
MGYMDSLQSFTCFYYWAWLEQAADNLPSKWRKASWLAGEAGTRDLHMGHCTSSLWRAEEEEKGRLF